MITFTEAQAAYANQVVLELMRKHRFFLYKQSGYRRYSTLDSEVFSEAQALDQKIRDGYNVATKIAEQMIGKAESKLGVAAPNLNDNQQVVTCSRYTGGFDIVNAYPLTMFAQHVPASCEQLAEQLFDIALNGQTPDDIAPKQVRELRHVATLRAQCIWEQFEKMGIRYPANERTVVTLKSRFSCESGDENGDFTHGRVQHMQHFPHALGFLFYRHSQVTRLVPHDHVVFSTLRRSHVNVQHWSEKEPTITLDQKQGYTNSVLFVTVL